MIAGAAALDVTVAEHAAAAGLTGLEFLSGIPGTIGGAVAMNAGAYGGDIAGVLDWAEIVTRDGERAAHDARPIWRSPIAMPACRRARVVTRARLRAPARRDPRRSRRAWRRSGPRARRRSRSAPAPAGPPSAIRAGGMKAWELIDAAGCRGLTRGGAVVSEKHCNFLINTGTATAADLEGLGEEVRRRVHSRAPA